MSIRDYLVSGFVSGALGDIILQFLDSRGLGNEGLINYFAQSSPEVSVLSAAVLTGFWSGVYAGIYKEKNFYSFGLFSALVDVFYRYNYSWLYPSLREYYLRNTCMETILFNVLVAAVVFSVVESRLV